MNTKARTATTTPPKIRCGECGQLFDRESSPMAWDLVPPLCDRCWDRCYWDMVKDLEPTGYPDEYKRMQTRALAITKLGQDHGEGEG